MITSTKRIALLIAVTAFLFSCKKKFNDYYERPPSLAPAIYQQLDTRGNFKTFLSLIDKAGYKQTLSAAGYWTLFAPTDSAFEHDAAFNAYLQSRNISGISAIDDATAQSVVQYLLVFNGFERDRLDDYQSNIGWIPDAAFKRRTAYYSGFYKDTAANGQILTAIASNRNNAGGITYYVSADNNNKYIPYFTNEFMAAKGLTATDYTYFFPGTTFGGLNIGNAKVTQANIAAENGVIYIIDKVVTPLQNFDEYLRTKPDFSEFKKLFDKYLVQFIPNTDATHRYQVLTGNSDNVYVKVYSNLLAFSPNNENYLKTQDNDGQQNGWTMIAPRNDSLLKYMDSLLKEGYGTVNALPLNVISDLLNAHMWQSTVWPGKFASSFNFLGEPSYSNAQTDIVDKKVLSNGIFYGSNKVNVPNVFSTVYGKAYLNPRFSMMTRLLDVELRNIVTTRNANFTMFMMPDPVLTAQGYSYNSGGNSWTYLTTTNDSNRLNLLRMLNSMVVETPHGELDNLGTPGFKGIIGTYGGEYIKYDGNQIITAGTKDRNLTVTIDSIKNTRNGRVVYLNNLLYFTYTPLGKHLEILGTPAASEYNLFWNYLKNSTAYDPANFTILGVAGGAFYTIFAPNNNAIRQAITDGLLPGTAATPNFTPSTTADKLLVEKFMQYHVLDKRSVINDGKDIGSFATLLKNSGGDAIKVTITYPAGVFELSDAYNRKAHLIEAQSNQLSNRTVIHLIDNYLKYN
ncbi:MAG: fasciclin domain-containing protein [Chitinophagaceae bacterium]